MNVNVLLVVLIIILLLGALPTWPYSAGWGYYPSGGLGLVVLIVIFLLLMGRVLTGRPDPSGRNLLGADVFDIAERQGGRQLGGPTHHEGGRGQEHRIAVDIVGHC